MAFEDDKARFMFHRSTGSLLGGSGSTTAPIVPIHLQNQIEPLLMGPEYFAALKAAITALPATGNPVIWLAGWWFTPLFSLDAMTGGAEMFQMLKARSRDGVDVRVLPWVLAPELMANPLVQTQTPGAFTQSYTSMRLVRELRTEPTMADKATCNILCHPVGAVHAKMAIVGNDTQMTAFTGGIDLYNDRFLTTWRDLQLRLTGPAAQGPFDLFRDMWNEVQSRPVTPLSFAVDLPGFGRRSIALDNRTAGTAAIPARRVGVAAGGTIHAQSLRTVPQFRFAPMLPIPTNQPVSFAPDGVFETDAAWRTAMGAADTVYYVEDQMLSSTSLCDALNARLRASDTLRIILLSGQSDPNDPPTDIYAWIRARAVNFHLLRGLTAAQKARVGLFNHSGATVHCKLAIADDLWAYVGSANFSARSQFTDFEHGFGLMDETGAAVPALRRRLWDSLFGAPEPDLAAAVQRWFDIPEGGAQGVLQRHPLPLPMPALDDLERGAADSLFEVDSREVWGSDLFMMLLQHMTTEGFGS